MVQCRYCSRSTGNLIELGESPTAGQSVCARCSMLPGNPVANTTDGRITCNDCGATDEVFIASNIEVTYAAQVREEYIHADQGSAEETGQRTDVVRCASCESTNLDGELYFEF
jgi:hypothetical protein